MNAQTDPRNQPDLVNIAGLANATGFPVGWLKSEAKAGRIPCLKIGARGFYFSLSAVRETLARRAAESYAGEG